MISKNWKCKIQSYILQNSHSDYYIDVQPDLLGVYCLLLATFYYKS